MLLLETRDGIDEFLFPFVLLFSFLVPDLGMEFAFFEWSVFPVSPSTPFPRTLLVLDGRIIPGKRDEIALEVIGDEMVDWFIVVDEDDKGV